MTELSREEMDRELQETRNELKNILLSRDALRKKVKYYKKQARLADERSAQLAKQREVLRARIADKIAIIEAVKNLDKGNKE